MFWPRNPGGLPNHRYQLALAEAFDPNHSLLEGGMQKHSFPLF